MAEEINEGLRILAERVKTNPDEFFGAPSDADKWWEAKRYMKDDRFPWTDEEKKLIEDIEDQIQEARRIKIRDNFTSVVMKTLMDEDRSMLAVEHALDAEPLLRKKAVKKTITQAQMESIRDSKQRELLHRALDQYRKEHGEL